MFPSYRNHSVHLHSESIGRSLYEANIGLKKVTQKTANHLVYNNLFKKLKGYDTLLNF